MNLPSANLPPSSLCPPLSLLVSSCSTANQPTLLQPSPKAPEPGEQLLLPLAELSSLPHTWSIPRQARVFVNRNLNLSEMDWIGFDMDYTLAIYDQPEMDRLQIQATLPKMLARGYPAFLATVTYDIAFPIRGLMIDKKLGNILKMDRYKVVQRAYHGLRELDKDEIRSLYRQKKIRLTAARYHWIDTLYALSEVTLYAAIVDAMEHKGLFVDYACLFKDIRECIDEAHRDGTVLQAVDTDYPRFVKRDPNLAQTLHKWRSAGKKLFLLTNSQHGYTNKMMHYLLEGSLPEYPTWRHFFDVVITAARKPAFFQEQNPFFEVDSAGALRPVVRQLERGHIYEGGNLYDFERLLGITGDRILYIGDHIYGDILRSKKESVWRTAMIIQEMTAEVLAHTECEEGLTRLYELEERRQKAEDELRFLQLRFKELSRQMESFATSFKGLVPLAVLKAETRRIKRNLEHTRSILRILDMDLTKLEGYIDKRFHAYWGSLLKESNELSSFGIQVEEYACLYTSKVSNFLAYSPLQHYRSPRDRMAHELY